MYNALLLTVFGGKTIPRTLNTLTKIGAAALTRLFNSATFRGANPETYVRVTFPKDPILLDAKSEDSGSNEHWGSLQFHSGTATFVWGIELGLKEVLLAEGEILLRGIQKIMSSYSVPPPSHVIIFTWNESDFESSKSYEVFRLTQGQDRLLQEHRQKLPMHSSVALPYNAAS